jgi:uncharacterized MAPEG superfamily protein
MIKTELVMLGWSAVLCLVLVLPYTFGLIGQLGMPMLLGNRDNMPAATGWVGRSMRAHRNMLENLTPFAALVLAVVAAGKTSGNTALAAEIFLTGRVLHALAYIFGVTHARTLGFALGLIGMIMLAVALLA